MIISLIAAMGENRVIGVEGRLPWHLPSDFRFFKATTLGHDVVMGRKTFESMGKALVGRHNIVVSRNPNLRLPDADVASSLEAALKLADPASEVFIAGGAEIYRLALPIADRIYMTIIHAEFEGDTFFPEFPESEWVEVEERTVKADAENAYDHTFLTYERRIAASS